MTGPASTSRVKALVLHTHDVARSLKPSADGELANALHETLHFALDGREQDWGLWVAEEDEVRCGGAATTTLAPAAEAEENNDQGGDDLPPARPGFFRSTTLARPYISYAWDERSHTLTLPNPVVIANPTTQDPCSPENRSDFDVTAKFFFLQDPQSSSSASSQTNGGSSGDASSKHFPLHYIDDALKRLTLSTSLITLDTFVVAFPTLELDRKVEAGDEKLASDLQAVREVWEAISLNPQFQSLGVADLSAASLRQLFDSESATETRKARLVTVNVKENPHAVEKETSEWCEKNDILLVAHNDQRDILPKRTMPALLQEFKDDFPYPIPDDGAQLVPRWLLKYSTVIRERGILADKGYILFAEWV